MEVDVRAIPPRAFVFVEEKRFLEPVRPQNVTVNNNTTIINKTVNITNVKVVNNTVINEGPRTQIIEQASGRKIAPVPVHELRRKEEAVAVAARPAPRPSPNEADRRPLRGQPETRVTPVQAQGEESARELHQKAHEQSQRAARDLERKAQFESEQHAKDLQRKAQEEAQRKARELQAQARLEAEQRARELHQKALEESQRTSRARCSTAAKTANSASAAGKSGHTAGFAQPRSGPRESPSNRVASAAHQLAAEPSPNAVPAKDPLRLKSAPLAHQSPNPP